MKLTSVLYQVIPVLVARIPSSFILTLPRELVKLLFTVDAEEIATGFPHCKNARRLVVLILQLLRVWKKFLQYSNFKSFNLFSIQFGVKYTSINNFGRPEIILNFFLLYFCQLKQFYVNVRKLWTKLFCLSSSGWTHVILWNLMQSMRSWIILENRINVVDNINWLWNLSLHEPSIKILFAENLLCTSSQSFYGHW